MHRFADPTDLSETGRRTVARHPLVALLRHPAMARDLDGAAWNRVLAAERGTALLGRVAAALEDAGLLGAMPDKVRSYLTGALLVAESNQRTLRWEARCLGRALADVSPIVLLKGAAYIVAGQPWARGRLASDVDILVPRAALGAVEAALLGNGWASIKRDAYDDHYYRAWMHELPPFRNLERGIVTDLHHTILPLTGRIRPDAARLIERSVAIGDTGVRVLAPADMVIHAVLHAFQDGDLANGLRDLVDIDGLLRHFGTDDAFWDDLVAEVRRHGAGRPWSYAVRGVCRVLGTPVPSSVRSAAERDGPPWPVRPIMDAMIRAAVAPIEPAGRTWPLRLARFGLYVRSHWLRMPPLMLARHLTRKARRRAPLA